MVTLSWQYFRYRITLIRCTCLNKRAPLLSASLQALFRSEIWSVPSAVDGFQTLRWAKNVYWGSMERLPWLLYHREAVSYICLSLPPHRHQLWHINSSLTFTFAQCASIQPYTVLIKWSECLVHHDNIWLTLPSIHLSDIRRFALTVVLWHPETKPTTLLQI